MRGHHLTGSDPEFLCRLKNKNPALGWSHQAQGGKHTLNDIQKKIVIVGLMAIAATCIYPPWRYRGNIFITGQPASQSFGYSGHDFLWSSQRNIYSNYDGERHELGGDGLDWSILLAEWSIIMAVAGAASLLVPVNRA
jgi:hypothetical protein